MLGEYRMARWASSILEGGRDVPFFQVEIVGQNLVLGCTGCEKLEDIGDPDAEAADTGLATALLGVEGNAMQLAHLLVRVAE
jgi:hypothetical protein